ncbi:MAG: hypothetical protein HDQ87_03935 [Clostridia bacterium]|nr:hypothetical protein [Clostridia bacterium]
MKKRYGRTEILNYDATFLYMVLDGLEPQEPSVKFVRCLAHPFARRSTVQGTGADYAADVNVLMAWAKADDDRRDEGGAAASVRCRLLARPFRRACRRVPAAAGYLEHCAKELAKIEQENTDQVDAACHPYAELLGQVFADGNVLRSHILQELGYNLGRWVYMIDALDDMEEDGKAGRFNVFVNRARSLGQTVAQVRESARFSLFYTLSRAQEALGRLELQRNRDVLNNIIRLGLRQQTESVLAGQGDLDRVHESLRSARSL